MKIDSDQWRKAVIDGALALGISVSEAHARCMGRHAQELLQWNRVTNLTAITDPLEVAVKHYVDALAAAAWIKGGVRVLDAGSGGGFPGIPLAILRSDLSVTLVDSVRKKVSFLKHAIRTLDLKDIDAVHGRLEDLCLQPEYHGKFDVAVCRAFSSLEDFVSLALPFLSKGGSLLAMKGRGMDRGDSPTTVSDPRTFTTNGVSFTVQVKSYCLPTTDAQRHLVMLTPQPEG